MPEKTMPMAVSSLTRLFSFTKPVAPAQSMPAAKAPRARGAPNQ